MAVAPRLGTLCFAGVLALWAAGGAAAHEGAQGIDRPAAQSALFDPGTALAYSRQAIGRSLSDQRFVTARGEAFQLAATRGKPLVVNLVYTSCSDVCPLTVQTLARAVDAAASAVGLDSFAVVTIGFDSRVDTPQRMFDFARAQGINYRNWRFLSADAATIDRLAAELGFFYAPAAGGFDHMSQVTLIDAEGRVERQIYGADFAPQLLVEPLKRLVFGGEANPTSLAGLLDRVKLICTVYDPATGRYRFSYAIFIEIIVGGLSLAAVAIYLVRAWVQTRRPVPRGP